MAALAPIQVEEAFTLVRRAYPFRDLERDEFDQILQYLTGGGVSLEKQYAGVFGKIEVNDGTIALAHPRIARDFLVNIGTILSESFIDVFLRRRRLGSVEENFIKQLNIGDLFVLAGRVVRLVDTGVQEAYVERADGQLPTVPRWNAAKMPLTSGLACAVRKLRTEVDQQLHENPDDAVTRDWLVENYDISSANAQEIVEQFRAQETLSEIPVGRKVLIELYREGDHAHYFFHSLIGRSANDALSRIVALRVKKRIGGNALATIDDYGFLLTLRRFQELPLVEWQQCFGREKAEEDLQAALGGSQLVKWQFDHPLLLEAYRQAAHTFLDAEAAFAFLNNVQEFDWRLLELPVVSPFSFPIYASVIKESMMLEDPASALERIYSEMYSKVEAVATAAKPA